jgi:hypothetical protein
VAYLTTADGTFTVQRNFQNGVSVRFQGQEAQNFWWLDFAAPARTALTRGLYEGAGHFPAQPSGRAGLSVSGQGLSCDAHGSFEILDVSYDTGGAVLAFHARFEQQYGSGGALVGEVRYEGAGTVSTIGPLTPTAEVTRPLSFVTRAFSQYLEPIDLAAPVLPDGATFADATGGRGVFSWTPGFDVSGTQLAQFEARTASGEVEALTTRIDVVGVSSLWYESEPGDPVGLGGRLFGTTATGVFSTTDIPGAIRLAWFSEVPGYVSLTFAAPGGAPLAPGIYDGAMRYPYQDSDRPGPMVQAGGFCDGIDGRFEVKEIRRGAFGEVVSFWGDFEQTCVGAPGGLRGEIR